MASSKDSKEIPGYVLGTLSLLLGFGSLWVVFLLGRDGGEWTFSVLGSALPLMLGASGLGQSKAPDAKWRKYTQIVSTVGLCLGVLSFILFLVLLGQSRSIS